MRKRIKNLLNRDDPAARKTFYHSMELLAVATVALVVGFVAADYVKGNRAQASLKTDANAQRPAGVVVPPDTSPPLKPSGEVDPVLKKPEKGTDGHG